ncbi:MAG: hypothetical protein H6703_04100 [Myxococcales bacterium]|nr:hypothetical protein [Myxococcales bacterium]
MTDRRRLRLDVWCEDPRQASFLRHLPAGLGFDKRRLEFHVAPRGDGAAERWVLLQYPEAMRRLRSRKYQQHLGLVIMRDGDRPGFARRVAEMDAALTAAAMPVRGAAERVALPFPQWCVESWLLVLLGEAADEAASDKQAFQSAHAGQETDATRAAAAAWSGCPTPTPSMQAADAEIARLG